MTGYSGSETANAEMVETAARLLPDALVALTWAVLGLAERSESPRQATG